jgi:DNA-binding Xre family transcriptional regulator
MAIIENRLPDLLAAKFGGKENINLTHIAQDSGLSFPTVSNWAKRRVDRADFPILIKWCKYLNCQPGDILVYHADVEA